MGNEQGWRSGESNHPPPMLSGFKSRRVQHMWVEFAVGSPLLLRFAPPNSNSIRNQVDEEPLRGCATSKSESIYLFVIYL